MLAFVLVWIVTAGGSRDSDHRVFEARQDAVLVSVDGVKRAQTQVSANPPKDLATLRGRAALFGGREGVRTEDGKVVNGIAFAAWRQNEVVVVAVFVLVPGNGQPNTNINVAAGYQQLSHRHLKNYALKNGEAVEIKEAADLGYGKTTIQLVTEPNEALRP